MTLLVLGAGGQVGRALVERAGGGARGFDRVECDILDRVAVERVVAAEDVSLVVNCAGYTAVDRAESERDRAFAINAEGAGIVARAAAARNVPIIHLSSDYVYSGEGDDAHTEDEPMAPLSAYGRSKTAGDLAVARYNSAHIILRVSWVFGRYGNNFVKTMLRLGRQHTELRIVEDQMGGPTEARDISDAILVIATVCRQPSFEKWGIYHFAGAPITNWYRFAGEIFERSNGPAPRLMPILTRDYPTAATRPLNSRLDCGKIRTIFDLAQPNWRNSLSRVLADLRQP